MESYVICTPVSIVPAVILVMEKEIRNKHKSYASQLQVSKEAAKIAAHTQGWQRDLLVFCWRVKSSSGTGHLALMTLNDEDTFLHYNWVGIPITHAISFIYSIKMANIWCGFIEGFKYGSLNFECWKNFDVVIIFISD
ncbi:hypothetical protein PoB_003132000 [Plakobranchus ocellatus]|uniref:Uncharacterized protein n=1 Tax=Plakobranchus ocellatus TaxID=259542 RepID=A0AAV4ADB2_9GAST|nr:hypothetical protein PoB_003132000 [Plakobranchus ocellatus]